jgi:hypothetical protein
MIMIFCIPDFNHSGADHAFIVLPLYLIHKTMKTLFILVAIMLTGMQIADGPLPLWTRFGEQVTIDHPVNGDVYVAGQNVMINARVRGDLVVAGGTVTINDTVTMDVLVGGGTVTINGHVGDDVRCAGGNIVVKGSSS